MLMETNTADKTNLIIVFYLVYFINCASGVLEAAFHHA